MRMLIDARPFVDAPHGGVGRVAFHLTHALAETFPNDEFVCATTGAEETALPAGLRDLPNIKRIHIRLPNKVWSVLCMTGLASLDRAVERKTDHCDTAFFPNIGFFGRPHIPHAILLHDLSFVIEPAWFAPKQRIWHKAVRAEQAIRQATHLFAVSQTTSRDAQCLLRIPSERITVLPMGPTIVPQETIILAKAGIPPTRFVLALGAGDARKNSATAVEAVRILRAQQGYQDLDLVLVGKTNHPRIAPWIHHVQDADDATMSSLYSRADAFLYPSWYEGYGLPLHEAAMHGTPRIASTSGALSETAPPGTIFANPAKPHHWAEALLLALKQKRDIIEPSKEGWREAARMIRSFSDKIHEEQSSEKNAEAPL